jgi:glutaredoxin 3
MSEVVADVVMYTTAYCPFCQMAERLLTQRGVANLQKIRVDDHPELKDDMITRSGRRTVPQIFIDNKHVGGFDDLAALDRAGGLQPLLTRQATA